MTTRDRTIIAILAIVAALAAGFFLLVKPRQDQAGKLATQVTEQRKLLADAKDQVATALTAQATYRASYTTLARLGEAVPTDVNEPSLVYQLDSAARHTGVDFRSVKLTGTGGSTAATAGAAAGQTATGATPPNAVANGTFDTMPFSLSFDGSFFRMSDFFHRLERYVVASDKKVTVSGRLLQVDGISLAASRFGFPKVKASIAATAFLLPAGQTVTGGGTTSGPATGQPAAQTTNGGSGSTSAPAATATLPRP